MHRNRTPLALATVVCTALAACPPSIAASGAPRGQDARAAFLRLIDRPRVPLAPEVKSLAVEANAPPAEREHITFAVQDGGRVPALLWKPPSRRGRRPAVILMHGTGGSKEDARLARVALDLVSRGVIAVAIDGRYHGERAAPDARATEYVAAMLRAYRGSGEHPFLYDTVWDILRLVDYLGTREDVDAGKIGLTGISKGGMESYLAAAVDPRIAVAVPVIGVQSFRWALDHDSWQSRVGTFQAAIDAAAADAGATAVDAAFVRRFYDRVVPGIYAQFDAPAMLPLIAPRPLLVINGDSDARTPLPGVRESASAAAEAYRTAGAPERFSLYLQPKTAHEFTDAAQAAAVDWFVRWLQP
jgi:dienelactone hydrolase